MSDDDSRRSGKSTKAAQQNKISHHDRKYPWHLPYLKTCIIKNCQPSSLGLSRFDAAPLIAFTAT